MPSLRPTPRVLLSLAGALIVAGCSSDPVSPNVLPVTPLESQVWATSLNVNLASMTRLPSGVYIKDDVVGTGATVSGTPTVLVYYAGYLASGIKFDERARTDGNPVAFPLATLIPGFKDGVQGMKVGGKRRMVIPAELAYGSSGTGPIPGNANILFDVEVTGIQ